MVENLRTKLKEGKKRIFLRFRSRRAKDNLKISTMMVTADPKKQTKMMVTVNCERHMLSLGE
jgi:hypothetical protein